MLTNLTVRQYAERLASGDPTPGGGSGAALVGALAAALAQMAGNFTVGKEKFVHVEETVQGILARLDPLRQRLLDLTDADADAYARVGAAYGMPRETEQQRSARQEAIQAALRAASDVPFAATEACLGIVGELDELRRTCNPNLLSDVGVAAELALAALRCAWLNVEVNLALIGDASFVSQRRTAALDHLSRAEGQARAVFDQVAARIRQDE